MGLIHRKQEKYTLAEYYFRQALEITPENPILLDCLASVPLIMQWLKAYFKI